MSEDFTPEEIEIIRENMKKAQAEALRIVKERGVKVHPRIIASRDKPVV